MKSKSMEQPELGRKISELRIAKRLTQSELADICHLNLRTVQRIESAEVMPRSHTVRVLFEALDYDEHRPRYRAIVSFLDGVIDLLNLKKKHHEKVILSLFSNRRLLSPCILS